MALGFHSTPQPFTTERHDEMLCRLDAAGASSPQGRSYHAAFSGANGGLRVF
jgi:hypothetical protein